MELCNVSTASHPREALTSCQAGLNDSPSTAFLPSHKSFWTWLNISSSDKSFSLVKSQTTLTEALNPPCAQPNKDCPPAFSHSTCSDQNLCTLRTASFKERRALRHRKCSALLWASLHPAALLAADTWRAAKAKSAGCVIQCQDGEQAWNNRGCGECFGDVTLRVHSEKRLNFVRCLDEGNKEKRIQNH